MNERRAALCAGGSLVLATAGALSVEPLLATAQAARTAGLGAYLGAGCNGGRRLAAFEAWLGRPVDQLLDAASYVSWAEMSSSASWIASCWSKAGRALVMSLPMLPRDGVSSFAEGVAGSYDVTYRRISESLVARGFGSSVVRIGWEFNGSWFPWSALKQPGLYVAHWRRIVSVMRSVAGARFRFDWCPLVVAGMSSPEPAYPGDDVVDIIGADVYNENWDPRVTTAQQRWKRLVDAPVGLGWHSRFAAAHSKPMSFPEWGTGTRPDGHGGGDDPYFVRQMAAWIAAHPVDYHNYWDYPARDYNGLLSDGSKLAAEAAFLAAFGVRRRAGV